MPPSYKVAVRHSEEFARVLGLSDDSYPSLVCLFVEYQKAAKGKDLPPHLMSTEKRIEEYNSLADAWNIEPEEKDAYQNLVSTLFSSKYLPRLVKALVLIPPRLLTESCWSALLGDIGTKDPMMARYMRTGEKGERQVFLAYLLEALTSFLPSEKSWKEWNREADCWSRLASFCRGSLYNFFPQAYDPAPFPWLPNTPEIVTFLLQAFMRVSNIATTPRSDGEGVLKSNTVEGTASTTMIISVILAGNGFGIQLGRFLEGDEPAREDMPWKRCEVGGYLKKGCSTSTGELAMMCCSGCKLVRYCSRDHQRADWKRHKPLCIAPAWD